MVQEAGYLRPLNNLTLNHCNMRLETEEIKSVLFDHYGYQEYQQLYYL